MYTRTRGSKPALRHVVISLLTRDMSKDTFTTGLILGVSLTGRSEAVHYESEPRRICAK